MNVKNYYLLIFAFIAVTIKWSVSFYYFPEALDTKIIHDSVSDAKLYYPLIKFLSELNFNYSYDPEIQNLKLIPLPFWGIFFHGLFLKIFGFYSFIILDLFCVFIVLIIFFYVFKIFFSEDTSIILSILFFLLPIIISNTFLQNIQYFNLFSEAFYNLRVPRPMITNLYFFSFILIMLKIVTERFYSIKNFVLIGAIMALSLSSFYYHFFTEILLFLFVLIYKFKNKFILELKNNLKYYLILTIVFLVISLPFFLNLYFHETEFTYRQCVYNLDWRIKTKLLNYFFNKYLSIQGILLIGSISFLTLTCNKISFFKILDKKVLNVFYFLFIASLISPILFILISTKSCVFHHFVNFIILNTFLFLMIFFLILFKNIIKFKFNHNYNFIFIFIFILFFSFIEFKNIKIKKNEETHTQHRTEFNIITKKIENRFNINESSILTFDTDIMIWSIMKNIKYLDLNMSIFTSKKDYMIEEDLFSAFKKLNLNEKNFELFIENRLDRWRYFNQNVATFFYYKYQANKLLTFNKSLDFEENELDHIKNTHLLLQQQQIIPRFELKRLKNEFINFNKKLIFPDIIILNITDNFYDYNNLNLNEYCNIFDGQFYKMYFKKENEHCNN